MMFKEKIKEQNDKRDKHKSSDLKNKPEYESADEHAFDDPYD